VFLAGNVLIRFRTRSGRPLKRSLTRLLCKLMKETLISSLDNRRSFRNIHMFSLSSYNISFGMERGQTRSYGVQYRTCRTSSVINADNTRILASKQNSNTGVLKYYYFGGLKLGASHIQRQNRAFRYSVSQRCTVTLSGTEQPL
jgi:hypothetical protein